jgi:hypothetical protein
MPAPTVPLSSAVPFYEKFDAQKEAANGYEWDRHLPANQIRAGYVGERVERNSTVAVT